MSRISKIPSEDWAPAFRDALGGAQKTPLEEGIFRIVAHKPEVGVGLAAFAGSLITSRLLSDRLTELVRLRIAFHNQCRSCMAIRYVDASDDASFGEDLVCSLAKPMQAPNLTDGERAALDFADKFATNHLAINDETYASLSKHFSEAEQVELGLACAMFLGIGRLAATWNMVEDLPKEYQDNDAVIAPWAVSPVIGKVSAA